MNRITSFKDLVAWQKAMELAEAVYRLTDQFPAVERFGLSAQIRRAAVSVPSNIAEGFGRRTRADYVRFLDVAVGSANEVETQLNIALRMGFARVPAVQQAIDQTNEVQRILKGLIRSLEGSGTVSVRGTGRPSSKT